jgi:hypothetical protein
MPDLKPAHYLGIFLLLGTQTSLAGLSDWLDVLKSPTTAQTSGDSDAGLQALSNTEMTKGLKQALDQGVQHAVKQLGQPGGYLDNARVRIPMPDQLAWTEKTLRAIGQDRIADDFVASMNHAAERAVPEVATVFGDAIQAMTLEDARGILEGPDDAATRYFRESSSDALAQRMRPIISEATSATGVTSYYKSMMSKAGSLTSLLGPQSVDLDGYVTQKAMDGLFLMIAEQEKLIRENPVERSTAILQKVFGSVAGSN